MLNELKTAAASPQNFQHTPSFFSETIAQIVWWRNAYFYGDLDMESIWGFFAFSVNMV